MLEPYDAKVSRTVLRGDWGGNTPVLPGKVNDLGLVIKEAVTARFNMHKGKHKIPEAGQTEKASWFRRPYSPNPLSRKEARGLKIADKKRGHGKNSWKSTSVRVLSRHSEKQLPKQARRSKLNWVGFGSLV